MTANKDEAATEVTTRAGKGKATPSRKAQEAAGRRPLVGDRSPEARKAQRAHYQAERLKQRTGMMAGEERYLTARDRGPQRRMARDIVDSRFTVGELVLPSMFVVMLVSLLQDVAPEIVVWAVLFMWALFIGIAVDGILIGRKVQKRLAEKFGAAKVERGVRWYAAMRAIQMRAMRLPKPQVRRGDKI